MNVGNNSSQAAKKRNVLPIFGEGIIVVFLIILIVLTFNYFKVINISSTFSILSFLPRQQSKINDNGQSSVEKNLSKVPTVVSLVDPKNKLTINNESDKFRFSNIPGSVIVVKGQFEIGGILSVKNNDGGSGISFKNNILYEKPDYRGLLLYYSKSNASWILEFRSNNQSKPYLIKKNNGVEPEAFTILISKDGKDIEVKTSASESILIKLSTSLYDTTNKMSMIAQVAPKSELTISGLFYQY